MPSGEGCRQLFPTFHVKRVNVPVCLLRGQLQLRVVFSFIPADSKPGISEELLLVQQNCHSLSPRLLPTSSLSCS